VVLMNPPFGLATASVFEYLRSASPDTFVELYASFVRRALAVAPTGLIGAITSRGFYSMTRLTEWRGKDFVRCVLDVYDLGLEVMDNAFVGSCAYILSQTRQAQPILILEAVSGDDRAALGQAASWCAEDLIGSGRLFVRRRQHFQSTPENKFLYKASPEVV